MISLKDVDKEHEMHSKSDNKKCMLFNANEVVDNLSKSLLSRYHDNSEILMRGNDFMFDSFQLIYYKCHKVNF